LQEQKVLVTLIQRTLDKIQPGMDAKIEGPLPGIGTTGMFSQKGLYFVKLQLQGGGLRV
jgi:hypothetical protein